MKVCSNLVKGANFWSFHTTTFCGLLWSYESFAAIAADFEGGGSNFAGGVQMYSCWIQTPGRPLKASQM
ncbi:hypothetical protein D3C84_1137180 [compost metagenome]